ncbi:popeye domain-containing protein 2 [Bombina bombina]|uniref:popeye domain-containing protein 2 n=1 Tax=Bombina bombina TaxID=8345 RepID=UPI00235AFB22|nr:popeye domain-containing protein 2 [Bombina bombina]XP_053561757.1 popeye domain-containing protein 2 [Bombina bombina]XP_053561758.1 popeye domain-containing protein 2 [Bombina bombina]XP_053561759.1 popeye domain-containing protein 2 [Bombina bombina]
MSSNSTILQQLLYTSPHCDDWNEFMEQGLYHLAAVILLLAFMGGSTIFGCIYIFVLLFAGFLCTAVWGWLAACGVDIFIWNLLLMVICVMQVAHLLYQLRKESYGEDYDTLYRTLYQPLQVPLPVFKEIAHCSMMQVQTLSRDQNYALEGKTPIDRLSLLISGRVKVSLDGQFLHYIFPYQFLDSPEWESLHPSEEGAFQVTLTAETDCTYVSWPRKKLYLLLAKEKYIARLFSVLLGFDISQKLYALNDKLFAKFGLRFDIRLPSLYHVLGPCSGSVGDIESVAEPLASLIPQDHAPIHKVAPVLPHQPPGNKGTRPDSGNMGEDSSSLILEDFAELPGSFMDYVSEGEYMK